MPFDFFKGLAGWGGNEDSEINDIVIEIHTSCVKGGQKPSNISSLAVSWTRVASRDLKSCVTYFCPGGLVVGGALESWEVAGRSEWWLAWCPQVLHFTLFDFLGTNKTHTQAV